MTGRHLAAVPDQPKRVALYVRVSSLMGRGGDDFHSPDLQIGAMRRATTGMREVGVIDDDIDQTGRTFSREGIEKIRRLVETGAVDAIAVYNVSRLGRNVLESLKFLTWLADRGVTILSATEHIDTSTPSGRWMLTNMLAIAEMRSDEIGAEWSRTISHRAAEGKHHGPPPTGYEIGADGRLVPDPRIGPAIATAFAQYAEDFPLRRIRINLQTASGLILATTSVKRLLQNRRYLGIAIMRGKGGIVEVPGAHPALVDEPIWERVQARLIRDRRVYPRLVEPKYTLSGLAKCGVCSRHAVNRPEKKRRYPDRVRLICSSRYETLGDRCTGCGTLDLAKAEEEVLRQVSIRIAELRGDVGTRAAQMAKATRAGLAATDVEAELASTRRAKAKLTEKWARGQIEDRTYEDTLRSLREAETKLAVALSGLRETSTGPEPGKLVALGERLVELWPKMNGTQRNRALRSLIERVEVFPSQRYRAPASERLKIHWR